MKFTIKNKNEYIEKIDKAEELLKELKKIFSWDLNREIVLEIAEPSEEGSTKKD